MARVGMNDSLADLAVFSVALAGFAFVMGYQAPREAPGCAQVAEGGRRLVRSGPGPSDCLYERPRASFGRVEDGRGERAQRRMERIR